MDPLDARSKIRPRDVSIGWEESNKCITRDAILQICISQKNQIFSRKSNSPYFPTKLPAMTIFSIPLKRALPTLFFKRSCRRYGDFVSNWDWSLWKLRIGFQHTWNDISSSRVVEKNWLFGKFKFIRGSILTEISHKTAADENVRKFLSVSKY